MDELIETIQIENYSKISDCDQIPKQEKFYEKPEDNILISKVRRILIKGRIDGN